MVQQTVLPFKLKRTDERITSRSGLVIFGEFMKAMGVNRLADQYMPAPKSGRGYFASSYIEPLSLTIYGGGESIEDTREIREDKTLRKLLDLKIVPSASAIGDWLVRVGEKDAIEGIQEINDRLNRKIIKKDKRIEYTLIVDPTIIETQKRDAEKTYLGNKGYRPVFANLKELGLVIAHRFKAGNDTGGRLEIIREAFGKMPEGKRISEVLLDSEYYTNEVMEYLNEQKVRWAIAVDKDVSVMNSIKTITDWKPFNTCDGISTEKEVGETIHITNKGNSAFRLIVLRWKNDQGDLFTDGYNYHCIASGNMNEEDIEQIVWRYNQRSQIENNIKELKNGFGMEKLPSGDFEGNAVYFGIGVMTYNLFIAQKLYTMPAEWKNKTIKSIRWLFMETAGKVIRHSRQIIFKIAACMDKYKIYLDMRKKTYVLSLE